ncbi:MAG: hypothetical protein K5790_04695 [Nitrosopumilus sp.]|nr:hypothetical protein [Nitrosopumilus sp.]
MPDESCRRCGGLLMELLICAKCKAATQFICRICAYPTIPRSHDQLCFRVDESNTKKPLMGILH